MVNMTTWRMGIVFILCLPVLTLGALVHRYSFDGNANDLFGTANGVLVNNSGQASYADGQLEMGNSSLPNSTSPTINYVDLPNGTISSLGTQATFETWVTWAGPSGSTWQRIFDFGTSDSGEGYSTTGSNSTYIFMTPFSGGNFRFGYRRGASLGTVEERTIDYSSSLVTNTQVHVAVTWNDTTSQVKMYLNGALINTNTTHFLLSQMPDNNNWLGRSQWPDTAFNGKYNEFRIHNTAMTDAQIAASYAAGPDVIAGDYLTPSNPSPANGSESVGINLTLGWQSDTSVDITGHRVYLGTDYNSVLNAVPSSSGIYQGTAAAGTTSWPVILQTGTQYYWRIEEVVSGGSTLSSAVWTFETYNPKANNPSPVDGATGVSVSGTTLGWTAGGAAASHRIYFGLSPETLQLMEDYYASTSWPTGVMNFSKTYYWRIDERESGGAIITGDVWSLTTMQGPKACLPGDLDGDCFVGIDDLLLFAAQWLVDTDCSAFDCPDLDRDQFVNLADAAVLASNWQQQHDPLVVINEIHYHSDNNKQPVEFIELYNAGAVQINLSNWILEDAIDYTFPAGTLLEPGQYLVVSQNPAAVTAKFGVSSLGPWTGKLSNEGEKITLRDASDNKIDEVDFDSSFPWPTAANGEGASMELLNPYLDNDLGGSWRPSGYHNDEYDLAFSAPTPGQINSVYVYTENAPPQIRQVKHQAVNPIAGQNAEEPRAGQDIVVTAKITDLDGVQQASLKYQLVLPGAYIPAYLPVTPISSLIANPHQRRPLNPAFEDSANWTTAAMVDDGSGQDAVAGDSVYTAVIPGQINRTLVRYRIETQDLPGHSVRIPYYDDGALNFACFVYDGVPAYTAGTDTVQSTPPYTYSADIMNALPAYTLITRAADLYQCNGYDGADQIGQGSADYNLQEAGKAYNWEGAFVYDGKVYDHIVYRARGGNGRYYGCKRSMKFRFNRGDYLQARDIYGEKFPTKWQHLVTGKMYGNKMVGRYGLNELMDMLLWNQAGSPAPAGWWFTFRVIDGVDEAPTTTGGQYYGDFWGLYIAWEDYDGAFLDNHGLPEGNLYKLSDKVYEGPRQLRYQAADAVDDAADYENIRWNLGANATAEFIENHMNTDAWRRFQTVKEAIRHYDLFSGATCYHCLKNSAWYFYPNYTPANNYLGQLWFLPFDVDDTWGPFWNMGIDHGRAAVFDQEYNDYFIQNTVQPAKAPIKQEYRNYIREFHDLHWQETVINPMIDELAKVIEKLVPAERDRWRLNPSSNGGSFDAGILENCVSDMKKFAFDGGVWDWPGSDSNLDTLANAENDGTNIPNTPTITYTGQAGYPSNALTFSTSAFSDPQSDATFAALKWRIAEYEAVQSPGAVMTEIIWVDKEQTWKYFKGTTEPSVETGAWRQLDFDDSGWSEGTAPIGYDTNLTMGTPLADMRHNYGTIYLRKKFDAAYLSQIQTLQFAVLRDDGFKLWINGQLALEENAPTAENLPYTAVLEDYGISYIPDELVYKTFEIANPSQYIIDGINVIAIQVINVSLGGSSDCYADLRLAAIPESPIDAFVLSRHPYELQPTWESDDITPFVSTVHIPGSVVKNGHVYRVRCTMKDTTGRWSHWSAPVEFTAGMPLAEGVLEDLRLTELMYNPAAADTAKGELNLDNNEFEFIELKNTGDQSLDISSVSITNGVTFSFNTAPTALKTLAPGQFVLVVKNQPAFESRYGTTYSSRIAGAYTGKLANDGEEITLWDYWNGTIVDFEYSDGFGWPVSADGAGHSLTPIDSAIPDENAGSLKYGGNWRASTYIKGSPGADDPSSISSIMINEVMAHTDYTDPLHPEYDSNDWIELYNPTGSSIGYNSFWYLSDDSADLKKWALPAGSIAAGGRVSFDEITGFHSPITSGFGLDKTGEYVLLSYLPGTSVDRVVDYVRFSGQYNTISWGRLPDGGTDWFFLANPGTRNTANANPVQKKAVISEIMYHPDETTTNDEYIELYNPSTTLAVNLYNDYGTWRLDNAVSYVFPAGKNIPANGKIVIVPFDPAVETDRLASFNTAYGCSLVANSTVFGPWTGDLSNAGERLALQEPQEADPPQTPTTWWINADQVIYGDYTPWVTSPDGGGDALVRISSAASDSGDNPANWDADAPSPGY